MYFKKQLQGTHKPNIYTRYTHTKPNTRPELVIKSQENKRGRKGKNLQKNSTRIKKMVTETDISIISLTGNGLKPMKRQTG